jgi:hypothetical protein
VGTREDGVVDLTGDGFNPASISRGRTSVPGTDVFGSVIGLANDGSCVVWQGIELFEEMVNVNGEELGMSE